MDGGRLKLSVRLAPTNRAALTPSPRRGYRCERMSISSTPSATNTGASGASVYPVGIEDVLAARVRLAPWLVPTPLRSYEPLDAALGHDIRVLVKHESHQPTNAFKIRNGLAALTALGAEARRRGVVCASAGNHGLGIAWAARALGVAATVCVPRLANPEKIAAIRGYGARVIAEGEEYDDAVEVAERLRRERGLTLVHSTNERQVIAGAGTMTLEMLEQAPRLDAIVLAVGGGSQAVGALAVTRALRPETRVYGVQAAGAAACYDSWRTGTRVTTPRAATFAGGIATRASYDLTIPALRDGLAGFVTVSDDEIADAMRVLWSTTHNLAEGAGAAGFAGLRRLAGALAGQTVGIVISGGNEDLATLRRVFGGS